jgi:glucose dehydrogenase
VEEGATGQLRAFDKDTLDELWIVKLLASGMATPMTCVGIKRGKQFVVIGARGGNRCDEESTVDSVYSAFASSSRCFSNWAVHVATGPWTVPNASPVS